MELFIFDKDGTLTETVSRQTFVQHPKDQKLILGVEERVKNLINNGVEIAIASNQGGVAARHKTLQDAIEEMQYCLSLLPEEVSTAYFCPDFEGKECYLVNRFGAVINCSVKENNVLYGTFRKPNPGMLNLARLTFGKTIGETIMIGDRKEDETAAYQAGIKFLDAKEWREKQP